MPSANYLLTEEQLLCCICLDVFIDPVTLPCGHNFCKNCISQHLNFNSQHQCPMCKECVDRKYKLGVNTFISEMAVQFRQSAGKPARNTSDQQCAKPRKVAYGGLIKTKRTALKAFLFLALGLACLTICFAINLKLHQILPILKTDKHYGSLKGMAGTMCAKHGKPLELYCKNEQMSICRSCADSSHRFHHVVPLKEEYEVKKAELRKTEAKIQQKILERQLKNDEIKHLVKLSKDAADRELTDGVQVFTALIQSLERAKAKHVMMIVEKQKMTEKQARGFIQDLEQETSELVERLTEVEQLSSSKDLHHFLQSFASLDANALTKDWTDVSICPAHYEGILRTAMVTAVDQLTETVRNEMKKLHEAELKSLQQNAVEVTLDPETAHPSLFLSDDGKQVHCGDVRQNLPDNSKRFEHGLFVLGKQSFSCGRFHYDVQVKGKTIWILGVAKKSVNRKGEIKLNPENGLWAIFRGDREQYFALSSHPVPLSVNHHPETVRVFVDYEKGLVSFYDLDAAVLLYSFNGCSFTENLYPVFGPGTSDSGRNSAPLIISPVNPSVN